MSVSELWLGACMLHMFASDKCSGMCWLLVSCSTRTGWRLTALVPELCHVYTRVRASMRACVRVYVLPYHLIADWFQVGTRIIRRVNRTQCCGSFTWFLCLRRGIRNTDHHWSCPVSCPGCRRGQPVHLGTGLSGMQVILAWKKIKLPSLLGRIPAMRVCVFPLPYIDTQCGWLRTRAPAIVNLLGYRLS